jgi:hypothetical protein
MSEDSKPTTDGEQVPPTSADDSSAPAPSAKAEDEGSAAPAPEASAPPSAAEEDDVPLDAAGRERPRFLLGFPADPELSRLTAAFEAGNYALVRAEAGALAERAESPAVRDAARELLRRIEPDPLAKYLLALTAALLLLLAYWAYHH